MLNILSFSHQHRQTGLEPAEFFFIIPHRCFSPVVFIFPGFCVRGTHPGSVSDCTAAVCSLSWAPQTSGR